MPHFIAIAVPISKRLDWQWLRDLERRIYQVGHAKFAPQRNSAVGRETALG
jgi:hypothetical protein